MKTMPRLAAILALAAPAVAAAGPTGFLDRVYKDADGKEWKYVLFVPHVPKTQTPAPLILFLHGSGESGNDGVKQSRVGLGWQVRYDERTFPAFVIFPQSEGPRAGGWQADSKNCERALAMLDAVQTEYGTDPKRVYLTGLSMGGYGTWSLAAKYPNKWAAIVPICGGGRTEDAPAIKQIPCWNFHGDQDKAVPVQKSRDMIDALKKAGGTPKYDEYPGVGHASWDRAYATPELFPWLFEQRLK